MIFLSPGVKSEEINYSQYVGQQSTCVVGMVGGGTKGPIGIPTLITSPTQLVETFGETMLDDYGIVSAIEYLKQGNILYYNRAAEDTAAISMAELLEGMLVIEALTPGTDGDNIAVEIVSANGSEARLNVYYKNSQKEQLRFSFDPQAKNYIDDVKSLYIRAYYNDLSDEQISIAEFTNTFVQEAENVFTLTSKEEIDNLTAISVAVTGAVDIGHFKVLKDSFGILQAGASAGTGVVDASAVTLNLDKAAQVKAPNALLSNLDVRVATHDNVVDENSFNSIMPAEYATDYPWTGPECAPLEGNPWIIMEVDIPSPSTTVRYDVYPVGKPEEAFKLEWHISKGVVNTGTYASAGKKYLMLAVQKTRDTEDTINLDTSKYVDGTFTFRVTMIKDDMPVQILEKDFSLITGSVDSTFVPKPAVIDAPVVTAVEKTPDGLRHMQLALQLLNIRGKKTDCTLNIQPTDVEVTPIVLPPVDPNYIPPITNAAKVNLKGGNNGTPLEVYTVVNAVRTFKDVNKYDINLIAAPGFWQRQVVTELISVAEGRTDCFAIIDPPQGLTVQQVIDWHNGQLEGDNYLKSALNTTYAALYYPWVQVSDVYTEQDLWIPPAGVVLAAYAYNDANGQPWFAPAGLNRAMLKSIIDVERSLDDGSRDMLYGNDNAVNPLVNYKGQGFTIWGQRTLSREDSALDRVNVRRLMILMRKTITASTAYFVFDQIDELSYRRWKGIVNPELERIKTSRGLYDYKVVMDDTTVTEVNKDRNEMPGMIFVKPTKTAEFIPISFIITSSGASFDV